MTTGAQPNGQPNPAPVTPPAPPPTEQQRQQAALDALAADRKKVENAAAGSSLDPIANPPTVTEPAKKPDGVPDKFWNATKGEVDYKAWGDSHKSLETKFHTKPDDKPVVDPNAPPAAPQAERQTVINTATTEFQRDGKISDATYDSLSKHGYDREMVDTFIEGQKAKSAPIAQALHDGAESAENYKSMIEWAASNLDEVEIDAYNAQLTSKNPAVLKAASAALYQKYRAVMPVEGGRVGGVPPAGNAGTFASKAEMTAAMSEKSTTNPSKTRYETDSAYRDSVVKKIAASRKAGIDLFV
jgi:hypothetical protein